MVLLEFKSTEDKNRYACNFFNVVVLRSQVNYFIILRKQAFISRLQDNSPALSRKQAFYFNKIINLLSQENRVLSEDKQPVIMRKQAFISR